MKEPRNEGGELLLHLVWRRYHFMRWRTPEAYSCGKGAGLGWVLGQ